MALPTPRTLLTSLINTLAATPSPGEPSTIVNEPCSMPSNPLKSLSPAQRKILTTLHVLFPTGMVLQSLDLLDRALVVKVTQKTEEVGGNQEIELPKVFPLQAHINIPNPSPSPSPSPSPNTKENIQSTEKKKKNKSAFYQVRSSQPQRSRFSHTANTYGQVYTVHLDSWNCSCAAFAFSAFPSSPSSSSPWSNLPLPSSLPPAITRSWKRNDGEEEEASWEFGGLSLDGKEREGEGTRGESVPVCKHLLACLLGERWGDVLGSYVKVREVGREEMGGLAGEG